MSNINQYPLEALTLDDEDYLDLDAFVGVGVYETKKLTGLNLKNSVLTYINPNLDARDTANRDRANHTGTQDVSTITGLAVVATTNDYNDLDNLPVPFVNKFTDQTYGYDMSQASNFNWNGLNINPTTLVTINERWRMQGFDGTGQPDGCFVNFTIPSSYTAGNDIRVILKLTCGNAGNAFFGCGLTSLGILGGYGGEIDATYQTAVITFLSNFNDDSLTFIFSGASLSPLKPLSINIYRQPQNPLDTNNQDAYINAIIIEEV
jgi:hypothetical protein